MARAQTSNRSDRLLLMAFFGSGFVALGYEILWTRILALALGSEILAVLGVLAGFFGGMVVGARWSHSRALQSPDPARTFARLEWIAAAYALISPWLLFALARVLPPMLGPVAGDNDGIVALVVTLLISGIVLLPATVCMGATLAYLVEARKRSRRTDPKGKGLGRLYAANTGGAVLGILVTVYVLLPSLGFTWGAIVLALGGGIAGMIAWRWSIGAEPVDGVEMEKRPGESLSARLAVLVFGTGLAGIGLEIGVVQVITQVLENTVFTFANILAVYLLGTAVGAWLFQRWIAGRKGTADQWTGRLLAFLTVASLIGTWMAWKSPALFDGLAPIGSSYSRHLIGESLLALIVFLLPTVGMGMLFSQLLGRLENTGVGKAYAWNTLGSALAPFLFGLGLIDGLGYAWALRGAVLLYGLLLVYQLLTAKSAAWKPVVAGLGTLLAAAMVPSQLRLVEPAPGFRVVEEKQGLQGIVLVTEEQRLDALGNPSVELQVGKHFRMGGGMSFAEKRMGHVPMLMAPEAKRVLFLGVGTGATVGAAKHYDVDHVDAVELVGDILEVLPRFDRVNDGVRNDNRFHFHRSDARRFVSSVENPYDLVVGDLFHPGRDGAGNLFSLEHFETVRSRLRPGGLFAQWIPMHEFDTKTLRILLKTYLEVFPDTHAFIGYYNTRTPLLVLCGKAQGDDPYRLDLVHVAKRSSRLFPAGAVIEGERDFLAAYFAEAESLSRFAGDAPVHTDRHPHILFKAPRSAYEGKQGSSYESLMALMPYRQPYPEGFVSLSDTAGLALVREEVQKTWRALGHYLEADRRWNESGYGPMNDAALAEFLEAYKADPRFSPSKGVLINQAIGDSRQRPRIMKVLYNQDRERVRQALQRGGR